MESYVKQNIYRHTFVAKCPNDGDQIIYRLEIKTRKKVFIEHIKTCTALIKSGFHEQIADEIFEKFGGIQTLIATHQGIEIETVRAER